MTRDPKRLHGANDNLDQSPEALAQRQEVDKVLQGVLEPKQLTSEQQAMKEKLAAAKKEDGKLL